MEKSKEKQEKPEEEGQGDQKIDKNEKEKRMKGMAIRKAMEERRRLMTTSPHRGRTLKKDTGSYAKKDHN
jgi:hypothetical protein